MPPLLWLATYCEGEDEFGEEFPRIEATSKVTYACRDGGGVTVGVIVVVTLMVVAMGGVVGGCWLCVRCFGMVEWGMGAIGIE
ncbi:Hypothetical predicted protein [Olea europaea subsp. europaea]|uniref:Transmembrane protein n=1 Tax=Olea europaea subsp. europaea TaxID=158383 RepID=A0A8S0THE3_OLEEU|nr:Hypothetical predicted protein [Olea europaea subsp. europaea]